MSTDWVLVTPDLHRLCSRSTNCRNMNLAHQPLRIQFQSHVHILHQAIPAIIAAMRGMELLLVAKRGFVAFASWFTKYLNSAFNRSKETKVKCCSRNTLLCEAEQRMPQHLTLPMQRISSYIKLFSPKRKVRLAWDPSPEIIFFQNLWVNCINKTGIVVVPPLPPPQKFWVCTPTPLYELQVQIKKWGW